VVNNFLPRGRRAGLAGKTPCVPPSPSTANRTETMKINLLIATCLALPFYGFTPPALAQTPTVEFASPVYTANRIGRAATITLVRSAAEPNDDASVVVYVSGGTATFPEDYYGFDPNGNQIEFFGTTSSSFVIWIVANHGPDETIILSLRSPRGVTLGKQTNATVNIVTTGPAVSFGYYDGRVEQNVSENEKFALITVHSLSGTNLPFSVDYATRDGTAKAGVDYTATVGTLAFVAGETEKTISIPLSSDDGVVDGDKTFGVFLTNATGGASIVGGDATVVIQDNEVPANLDYGFKPVIRRSSSWIGRDNSDWDFRIEDLAVLPDGKVLIGGGFTRVNDAPRTGLAWLNPDGSLAPTFHTRLARQDSCPADVSQITALPDGRVYLTGDFDSVNGTQRSGFARLLPDGSLDASFAPTIFPAWPWSLAVQPDGKIVANTDGGLVRLNETGSRDGSFVSALGTNSSIVAFAEHADSKLLVTDSDGQMIRLNTNGSRDDSFRSVSFDSTRISILVQTDQKILVGGRFTSVNGVPRSNLVRLNADGSPDSSFDSGAVAPDFDFRVITLSEDGKVLLLGWNNAGRLNTDGSLDASFSGFHYGQLDEGSDLIGGSIGGVEVAGAVAYLWGYKFSAINGSRVHGLGRILLDGNPRTGIDIQSAHTHGPDEIYSGADYLEAAGENEAVLRVKVRRLGETIFPASVTFSTRDGTAIAGRHYSATTATLSFAPLEQEKIVTIPVLHNPTYDGPVTLELFLTNVVGAEFLAPPLVMTIFDEALGFEPGAITRDRDGTTILSVRVQTSGTAALEVSNDLKTWETLQEPLGPSLFRQMLYDEDASKFARRFYRVRTE